MKRLIIIGLLTGMIALLGFAGCKGKSGTSGTEPTATGDQPSFNIASASQLIALSNTVAAAAPSQSPGLFASLFGKKPLFTYQIVNQGLADEEVRARTQGRIVASTGQAADAPAPSGTNLLAVDSEGNAALAITSNYLVKVMYSVTDPAGEYVYLALDPGLTPDGNDYSQFIGMNNCAFYKVKISDNSYSCVMEGVYVQNIDSSYSQTISNNQKPIQFDNAGNVYFPASTFTQHCDDTGRCSIIVSRNQPRIYRASSDGTVIGLTQDNQNVTFYLVMSTGQIAYQSSSVSSRSLYLWQPSGSPLSPNGTTINLTGSMSSTSYFAVDGFNTIMWSGSNGIKFARPISSSGVEKAMLNTSIFSPTGNTAVPSKIIIGDDGKLYGVFTDSKSVQDPVTKQYTYYSIYRVFEVLPANIVPKYEIQVPSTSSAPFLAVSLSGSTPFQVSKGFLFYKETKEKLGYGTYDIINMVDLRTQTKIPLLEGASTWYEIYSWRLRGNKLYFSALDLARTVVISGEIDVALVQEQPQRPQTDYFSYRDVASALGATGRVQDIEGLTALPTMSVTAPPRVSNFYTDVDNIYSASIEFNKLMNTRSVEDNLTFSDPSKNIVTMKVWINNFLHLIPDLDNNGTTQPDDALLDLRGSTPLAFNTAYAISIGTGATDFAGTALAAAESTTLQTRPESGWYVYGNSGKYAGLPKDPITHANTASFEYYSINVFNSLASTTSNLPADFRFQFRARNKGQGGLGILVYDASTPYSVAFPQPPYWQGTQTNRFYVNASLGRSSNFQYQVCGWFDTFTNQCGNVYWNYANTSYDSTVQLFTGDWLYYRFDLYGDKLALSFSRDGLSFTPVPLQYWDSDQGIYITTNILSGLYPRDTATHTYQLYVKTTIPVDMDDIQVAAITGVDGSGNPLTAAPLVSENFNGRTSLTDAPALNGTQNSPIFTAPTTTQPYDPYNTLTTSSN